MPAERLNSEQPIPNTDGQTVADFWSWAYSDILTNTNRGVFGEFLVAAALGLTNTPRIEWDAVDLRYGGYKVEVKSSAYCQTWEQKAPSTIQFDIAKKTSWDATTNKYDDQAERSADVYVFCLFAEQDKLRARETVIDAAAWRFYVVATTTIDAQFGNQKTICLSRLEAITRAVTYGELQSTIEDAI